MCFSDMMSNRERARVKESGREGLIIESEFIARNCISVRVSVCRVYFEGTGHRDVSDILCLRKSGSFIVDNNVACSTQNLYDAGLISVFSPII